MSAQGRRPPRVVGFALFTYSNERYEDNILPTGMPFGTPEDALDLRRRALPRRPASLTTNPRRINAVPH